MVWFFCWSVIFPENRNPLFPITLWRLGDKSRWNFSDSRVPLTSKQINECGSPAAIFGCGQRGQNGARASRKPKPSYAHWGHVN
jgi:hypothetical protein